MTEKLAVENVAVFVHPTRSEAIETARSVAAALERNSLKAMATEPVAEIMQIPELERSAEELAESCDLSISIGGDGTVLSAFCDLPHVPIVGVNCGVLGFLARVPVSDSDRLCEAAAHGELEAIESLAIETTVRQSGAESPSAATYALNDVAIQKGSGRAPYLTLSIDGTELVTFIADSVIVAAPTGSTAYNFSAGGPVMMPGVEAFTVTPVAAHSLWDRSLVLGAQNVLEVAVTGDRSGVLVCDGREIAMLAPGDIIRVEAAASPARLVRWGGDDFIDRIRHTFNPSKPRS